MMINYFIGDDANSDERVTWALVKLQTLPTVVLRFVSSQFGLVFFL